MPNLIPWLCPQPVLPDGEQRVAGLQKTLFQREGKVPGAWKRVFQRMSTLPSCRTRVFHGGIRKDTGWKTYFQGVGTSPWAWKTLFWPRCSLPWCRKRVFRGSGTLPRVWKRVFQQVVTWVTPRTRVFQGRRTCLSLQKTIGSGMGRWWQRSADTPVRCWQQKRTGVSVLPSKTLPTVGTRCAASHFKPDPAQRVPAQNGHG